MQSFVLDTNISVGSDVTDGWVNPSNTRGTAELAHIKYD